MTLRCEPKSMTTEEIRSRLLEVGENLSKTNTQLLQAKLTLKLTGKHPDPSWYHSALTAKKCMGHEIQALQFELGARLSKERNNQHNSVQSIFIDVIRERLGDEVYTDCMNEAYARVQRSKIMELKGWKNC